MRCHRACVGACLVDYGTGGLNSVDPAIRAPLAVSPDYLDLMPKPSQYELDAWRDIQQFKGRQVSRRVGQAGQRVAETSTAVGERATGYLGVTPKPSRSSAAGRA